MDVRGIVAGEVSIRTVTTSYGESDLAEVPLHIESLESDVSQETDHVAEDGPDRKADESAGTSEKGNAPSDTVTSVTLWGKWTESAELLTEGMTLLVTDVEEREYRGERQYSTTGDSYVVVEPGFLVNVTAIRSWVECPRLYYLNKLSGIPLNYPVVKGTIVHEVFGDLLRGRDLDSAIDDRIEERGLELGLLGEPRDSVEADVRKNAAAIEGWLEQGRLTADDEWRSEQLLISETFGIRGRADAIRRGAPVELKTGKNLSKEPRFKDKVQAACYALLLEERGEEVDTGTLLYTKNSALDRNEETGDLTPAKDFSLGDGLTKFVVRVRNEIAATEVAETVPTGHEGNARCEYCFEQDTCMVVSGRLDQESKAGQIGHPLPPDELSFFEATYRAIEKERRAVHREYAKLWEQTAAERADDDRALVDLEFLGKRELDGGEWELRARPRGSVTSKIREGDLVLASDGHPVTGTAELARIERFDDEIVLTADEPVAVTRLDVYPSELTTDRLLVALHDALLKGDDRRKDVLFGRAEPRFDHDEWLRDRDPFIENNDAQNEAVKVALAGSDCAMIHGPPGTGKTYTIARAIRAMVERGERVLLAAFTNRAVDNALEALLDQVDSVSPTNSGHLTSTTDGPSVVRVGSESGVREDMLPYRLERSGEPADRVAALENAQVVAATTASCGSRVMKEQSFDVAIVDEAAQLTEPGTYAAINLANRFVLVGDHQQLPPVLRSGGADGVPEKSNDDSKAADSSSQGGVTETGSEAGSGIPADLSTSLFERLLGLHPDAGVMLDRQYRMNQRIQAFASNEFYGGRLRPATGSVAGRTLDDLPGVTRSSLPDHLRDPVSFVNVSGTPDRHTDSEEARTIAEIIDTYVSAGLSPSEIGVIAPFRAQVSEITTYVSDAVTVDTVDRFQGSSEEVIVVSFTATGDLDGPIFEDYRRINVALTRPKRALVLVGDASALSSDPVYRRILEWATVDAGDI